MNHPVLRAKVRVSSVTQSMDVNGKPESETVKMSAVYGTGETANAAWSKYTPSADISITITNPEAFGKLTKGGFHFLDFTPANIGD